MSQKKVTAVWREGTVFEATPDSGFTVRMDGDAKAGTSPVEMILMGLAGCMGADVIDILRKKRQNVASLEIKVQGDRAADHPKKYTAIAMKFIVTGTGIDPEAVRRALELSDTKYCSVAATLRPQTTITLGFEIHDAELIAA